VTARFQDRRGRTVEVRPYRPEDRESLLQMYRTFDPAHRAQGIPPLHPLRLVEWVDLLTREGLNVVAIHAGRVVGHAVLMPERDGAYELAIFVHQDYQGAGIGARLIEAVLQVGRERGVRRVWLTVEPWNTRAIAAYRRAGFRRTAADPWEEVWELTLDAPTDQSCGS
jgi:RimJ/RimL family protein N-acetyltransferase